MNTFIGCLLSMGIIKLPNFRMYWSTSSRIFSVHGISELMSLQRFKDIYSMLCLRDSKKPEKQKIEKIEPIVLAIVTNSQLHYLPRRELSIDESMIAFNGRCNLKVYMPLKPVKYGLKVYMLCEAATGFVINWMLHTGNISKSENGVTYKTVMSLVEGIEGEYYKIFMDRFYTSIPLLIDLKAKGIGACGTTMKNCLHLDKNSLDIIEKLKDREIVYFEGPESITLTGWKDHKTVLVASNYHNDTEVKRQIKVRKKDASNEKPSGSKEEVIIPESISHYIDGMDGVDSFDQLSSYYIPNLKSKRWYMKAFFHLLEISIMNSYIIYSNICQKANKKSIDHLSFRKEIIRGLIQDTHENKKIPITITKKS